MTVMPSADAAIWRIVSRELPCGPSVSERPNSKPVESRTSAPWFAQSGASVPTPRCTAILGLQQGPVLGQAGGDRRFATLEQVVDFYNQGGIKNPHLDKTVIPWNSLQRRSRMW